MQAKSLEASENDTAKGSPSLHSYHGAGQFRFERHGGLTFLTSFLLHSGVFHLLGNVYFLLVFGNNVEDWLGKWRFLLLLLCATLIGDVVHVFGNADSTTPCIGASGGISGVVAFYALKFPRVRLGFLMRLYLWFRWISVPAYAMFFIWMPMQFLGVDAGRYLVENRRNETGWFGDDRIIRVVSVV